MTKQDGLFAAAYRAATIGIVGQVTLIAFQTIAVATAMPTAVESLDGLRYYAWSFTGFLIANVISMVLSGLWCDRHGAPRSMGFGLASFAVGLLLSGIADNMAIFVAGRAFQGFGAGLFVVAMYVVIGEVYPDKLRPTMFALVSAAWVVPALVGPIVAGALAEVGLWRWIFQGLVPIVAIIAFPVAKAMAGLSRPTDPPRRNYSRLLYGAAAGAGLAVLQIGAERLGDRGDVWALVYAGAGAAALWFGLRTLWPKRTLRLGQGIPATVLYRGLLAGTFFGMEAFLPLTLTTVHGYTETTAGLPLLVGAVAWSAGSYIQGRSSATRQQLIRAGSALVMSCAALLPVLVLVDGTGWLAYPIWFLGGMGMGLALSSLGVVLLELSPVADRGANSAALQLSEAVVVAVSVGAGGALVAASLRGAFSFTTGVSIHDAALAALCLIAVLFTHRLTAPQGRR